MPNTQPDNALAVATPDTLPIARRVFGEDRIQILKDVVAKGCTDAELEIFALVCQRTKLDPFARPPQIYAIKRKDKGRDVLTIQASIDSFRLVAARTREYQGQLGPFWCGPDEIWKEVWLKEEHPTAARVGVLRKGFREPIWSVAVWDRAAQYVPAYDNRGDRNGTKLGDFWERMGPEMLAKTAEANALKRAFPNDTEGLELAAIEAEIKAGQASNARRYNEIFGDEDSGTAYDLPPHRALNAAQQLVDTESGEILDDEADPDPGVDESEAIPDDETCSKCHKRVFDQRGDPINENQRTLLLERFGAVLCKDCRAKAGAT